MQNQMYGTCTVCGHELTEPRTYGQRPYCERHLKMFSEDIQPIWQTSIFMLGLLLGVIAVLAIVGAILDVELTGLPRIAVGVALSVLPALVWMVFLTRLASRREVPLSPLLPTVFILAALIAAAIARPVLYEIIDLDGWLGQATATNRLLADILLGGSIHAFLLYAIIRYTVWQTPAFERRVDGILYSLVAAWGYAATFNALYVLDIGGLTLLNGSFRILSQTCAFLVTGLIVGYFLGRNRFEDMPFYFLTGGVALAAAVNGFLFFAGTELNNIRVNLTADGFSPWPGLLLNVVAILATYAAIYGLLQRQNAITKARLERKAA